MYNTSPPKWEEIVLTLCLDSLSNIHLLKTTYIFICVFYWLSSIYVDSCYKWMIERWIGRDSWHSGVAGNFVHTKKKVIWEGIQAQQEIKYYFKTKYKIWDKGSCMAEVMSKYIIVRSLLSSGMSYDLTAHKMAKWSFI